MGNNDQKLKVALVHDSLITFGGAERVLYALHNMFPAAPIYTLFYKRDIANLYFPSAKIKASFLQKFPSTLKKRFKWLAPLAIPAIESFDFAKYDIVISSCAFFAKGVITSAGTVHICYCHTPTKYLWELSAGKGSFLKKAVDLVGTHFLRIWDFASSDRVDYFIANSKYTKKRIKKYYKKDAFVVYPPADIAFIDNGERASKLQKDSIVQKLPENYFLIVSQLQNYKNIDVAVRAFSKLKYPLVVIGEGPLYKKLKKTAGKNTIFLGRQSDDVVKYCYENCYAYVHPAKDDFGISPVEAMLFGKPVLAYRGGGAQESVVEGVSGEFFDDAHPAVLADGVRRLVENYDNYSETMIRQIGARFSKERFAEELRRVIKKVLVYELNSKGGAEEEGTSAQSTLLNLDVFPQSGTRTQENANVPSETV